ncbi:MAG: hypothetical protein HDT33_09985 [Clostridiales bacterium]|nr:hypothetical protein [Clostridiales bacterium]
MKRWKKGLLAAVLLAALALGMASPAFGSGTDTEVNLMAVNETVLLELTTENMPRTVGGVLYVPYTMLSNLSTGIDLGISSLYSATRRMVVVTNRGRKGIVFDLQTNTAQDLDGNPVSARAMVRNNTVFVPIDWLCQYFGTISCSRTPTPYGTLIRVTSANVILSDQSFVDAADSLLASSLSHYLESVGNANVQLPPSGGAQTSEPPSGAELYMAFRCGDEGEECARLVEGRELRSLFLFTPEQLEEQDDLVRRLVGAGHTVGLLLTGENTEDCLTQGSEGAALLAAIARYPALVVSAPNLDEPGREELAEAGYALWDADVFEEDYPSGSALVRGLSPQWMNYVELDCGSGGAAFLREVLNAMDEEECQAYQPTAPALA